jgi:KUP system potassium uptake protein
MPRWQDLLFVRLSRSANDYFQIPRRRVVEEERRSQFRG